MAEWKNGKAERYIKAVRLTDKLKTVQDTEKIKETLRNYIGHVSRGIEPENEFLQHEIAKTYKKNSFIGKALEEMDSAERKKLLRDEYTEPSKSENTIETGKSNVTTE